MDNEVAWLIEMTAAPPILYFSKIKSGVFYLFDTDPNNAIRFSRKQDAEAVLSILQVLRHKDIETGEHHRVVHGADCYAVSEHMWCAVPSAETKSSDGI